MYFDVRVAPARGSHDRCDGRFPLTEALQDVATVLELRDEEPNLLELLRALRVRLDGAGEVPQPRRVVEDAVEGEGAELEVGIDEGDDRTALCEEELRVVVKVELRARQRSVIVSRGERKRGERTWRTSLLILNTMAFFIR